MKKNNTKNYLFFVSYKLYPSHIGGIELYNYYLIKKFSLIKKVSLISLVNIDEEISGKNYILKKAIFLNKIWLPFQVFNILAKNRKSISLVHTSFARTSFIHIIVYPILNFFFGLEYSITIHGGRATKWRFKFPYIIYFKKAKEIIAVSQRLKEVYESRIGRNINYFAPLIPFDISENTRLKSKKLIGIKTNTFIFLYIGSLKKIKSVDTIIRAFNRLKSGRDIVLLIIGDGVEKENLIKLTNKNKDRILFLGNMKREWIKEYYNAADVYIISSEFEGTPLSLLEAMANKKYIIASNVSGINSIIIDKYNGHLFPFRDDDFLAKLLAKSLNNHDKEIKNNAYNDYKKYFNHDKMLNEIEKLLFYEKR